MHTVALGEGEKNTAAAIFLYTPTIYYLSICLKRLGFLEASSLCVVLRNYTQFVCSRRQVYLYLIMYVRV